ncbi:MAG: protein translocase subunit SecF [Gammaproteobacteria bacterium]
MEFFKKRTSIDFLGQRKYALALSLVMIVVSLVSMVVRGFNFGLDFTGGTLIEVVYEKPVELDEVRATLSDAGFDEAVVQHFGTTREVMVRLAPRAEEDSKEVSARAYNALSQAAPGQVEMRRVEFVGPQVGEELREQGGLAMLIALFGILTYVWMRYERRMAIGAILALVHDPIIILGVFSLWQIEFDLTVLAAVLAVLGYSVNDTIVVFDRIRENFRKVRKGSTADIINLSVNETLSRTIMTGVTVLLILLPMLFFGGSTLFGFALSLTIGLFVGVFSTIYIASAAALLLGVSRADFAPVKKEGAEADSRP